MPTALVTGASRGIGKGIALALAKEGFDLVINYAKNLDAAKEVQSQITTQGQRAHLVQADISIPEDRQKLLDESLKTFGSIDLLINNAGVAPDIRADLLEASEQSFDRLININLKGPYFLTQIVAKQMIEHKGQIAALLNELELKPARDQQKAIRSKLRRLGHYGGLGEPDEEHAPLVFSPKIINITSISAYTASVNRGDYCIAKAGLSMMTQLFAARLAQHNINVYEIRPGVIQTDMTGPVKAKYDDLIFNQDLTPLKRWGQPDDIAKAVIALAKDLFPFSTGEILNIDGGFHMRRL